MNYGMRFVILYRRKGSRPSPWKRNAKKQNAVWGSLTNSYEKRRSECRVPRIARRDKKAFHSDQCKGIVENNRREKTRDLNLPVT